MSITETKLTFKTDTSVAESGRTNKTIRELTNKIIKTNDVVRIFSFAKETPNLPNDIINDLAQAIIKLGYVYYIIEFAKQIPGAPINVLAQAIINYKNNEYKAMSICKFAKEVVGAPIETLEQAVIETKNHFAIREFARGVTYKNIDKLTDAIIELNNPAYIYHFVEEWDNPGHLNNNEIKLAQAFIQLTNKPEYIYLYAINTVNPPIDILADAIIKTNNAKFIGYFLVTVPNIPEEITKKLAAALNLLNDQSWLYDFNQKFYLKIKEQMSLNIYSKTNLTLGSNPSLDDQSGQIHM